jgi:hypothetical protein
MASPAGDWRDYDAARTGFKRSDDRSGLVAVGRSDGLSVVGVSGGEFWSGVIRARLRAAVEDAVDASGAAWSSFIAV